MFGMFLFLKHFDADLFNPDLSDITLSFQTLQRDCENRDFLMFF